jgi:hypothetical protein
MTADISYNISSTSSNAPSHHIEYPRYSTPISTPINGLPFELKQETLNQIDSIIKQVEESTTRKPVIRKETVVVNTPPQSSFSTRRLVTPSITIVQPQGHHTITIQQHPRHTETIYSSMPTTLRVVTPIPVTIKTEMPTIQQPRNQFINKHLQSAYQAHPGQFRVITPVHVPTSETINFNNQFRVITPIPCNISKQLPSHNHHTIPLHKQNKKDTVTPTREIGTQTPTNEFITNRQQIFMPFPSANKVPINHPFLGFVRAEINPPNQRQFHEKQNVNQPSMKINVSIPQTQSNLVNLNFAKPSQDSLLSLYGYHR